MNFLRTIAMLTLFCVFGCSGKFTSKDRFEGEKDGVLRIYIRFSNEAGYDENDKAFKDEMLKIGSERLKLLAAQGIVEKKYADEAFGSIAYTRCFDEYCEGFIDYKKGSEEKK